MSPSRLRFEAAVLEALARAPGHCMSLGELGQVPGVAEYRPSGTALQHIVFRIDDVERRENAKGVLYAALGISGRTALRIAAECQRRAQGIWYSGVGMLRIFSESRLRFESAVVNALATAPGRRLPLWQLNSLVSSQNFSVSEPEDLELLEGVVDTIDDDYGEATEARLMKRQPAARMFAKGYVNALQDTEACFQAAVQRVLERAPERTMSLSDLGMEESVAAYRHSGKFRTQVEAVPGVSTFRVPRDDSDWGGQLHAILHDDQED